jgi:hypothetical protein
MQKLSYISGRTTWLFDIADLNPKGKNIIPDILDWLKETYHFQEAPEFPPKEENQGLVFKRGEFQTQEEFFVEVGLTLFNDGLVASSSSSTEDAEKFLADVMKTASSEFSLTFDVGMIRKTLYLSELVIKLDYPLSNLNPRLADFSKKLSSLLPDVNPFSAGGISFWTDSTFAVTKTAPFFLERKLNAPFSENKYISKAPIPTQQHLTMLEEFEELLRPH